MQHGQQKGTQRIMIRKRTQILNEYPPLGRLFLSNTDLRTG